MKKITVLSVIVTCGLLVTAQAEPKAIKKIVDVLHEAKASAHPVKLLEKAKTEFEEYKAEPGHAKHLSRAQERVVESEDAAAHRRKHAAIKAIDEAIAVAKSGGDATSKIDAAIAEIHNTGALRR